jgi:two-component system NtrC family sensor kinase
MASGQNSAKSIEDLEGELVAAERRYELLVRRAAFGIYRCSLDGRIHAANDVLAAILGYDDSAAIVGLGLAEDICLAPADAARLTPAESVADLPDWMEMRWKRRDGSPIHVRVSVLAHSDGDGRCNAWEGVVQDVTERQRGDELRRRSERMASLGTTLAGVAHELNNPLAAIMGFTQLLMRKPWPAEDRSALETINHEAIRSATIVKDLLAMARKRDQERRIRTNVNDVVGYVARTRRYALETAGVRCRLSLDPTLPAVFGDRTQLEQVFLNLLNNAEHALTARSDASRLRGNVLIRTHRDDSHVIVDVQDDGPGIPTDVRAHIWDPFWTTKDEGEGTGLGLAVVNSIIEDHGGTITLEDGAETGACFVIRLPIARDADLPAASGHAPRPLAVLVVDPGASDLSFVERFLTSRGHAVVNARSGALALRLAADQRFDAIVCDARLLDRDGTPVAAALRMSTGGASARFVLSYDPTVAGMDAPSFDGAMLVARPYDVEELRRLIEGD